MKVTYTYDKSKDIWCLLNKGKSSNNSQNPTKQYEQLVANYGENPTEEQTGAFIDEYIAENNIDISRRIEDFQRDWESISTEFQRKAESIFSAALPDDVTAYLTVNSRCPYDIRNKYFYVSLTAPQPSRTAMHELWHFYTLYGLGTDQEEKIGKQKYNDLKESLTVLLNVECKNLLPEGVVDMGYTQHQDLRKKILEYWEKDKNIKNLWNYLSA